MVVGQHFYAVLSFMLAPGILDARHAMDPISGWKQIHIWVGNETSEVTSPFYSGHTEPRSHSQVGQDNTVIDLYGEDFRGYFIDLAANDAVTLSNTLMLERDFDWDGLCIEAQSMYWPALARRKCKLVGAVVGKVDNEIVYFSDRKDIGGIAGNANVENLVHRTDKGGYHHTVNIRSVFQKARVPAVIDYLSFDVEGAEWFIAQSFPWADHKVNLMTVERPNLQLKEKLIEVGMVYLRNHGGFGDQMWCHKSMEDEFRVRLKNH